MKTTVLSRVNLTYSLLDLPMLLALICLTALSLGVRNADAVERFDHDTTGFLLNGAHTRATCETCHAHAIFKGTPTRCQGCHGPASSIATTRKGPNHIASVDTCDDCHTEVNWSNARMDHMSVTGSCNTCHNGIQATGKSANHIQSGNQCDQCHRTVAWLPASFDHSSAIGACYSCHNGIIATGKSATHISSSNDCGSCHSTTAWSPASQ